MILTRGQRDGDTVDGPLLFELCLGIPLPPFLVRSMFLLHPLASSEGVYATATMGRTFWTMGLTL